MSWESIDKQRERKNEKKSTQPIIIGFSKSPFMCVKFGFYLLVIGWKQDLDKGIHLFNSFFPFLFYQWHSLSSPSYCSLLVTPPDSYFIVIGNWTQKGKRKVPKLFGTITKGFKTQNVADWTPHCFFFIGSIFRWLCLASKVRPRSFNASLPLSF